MSGSTARPTPRGVSPFQHRPARPPACSARPGATTTRASGSRTAAAASSSWASRAAGAAAPAARHRVPRRRAAATRPEGAARARRDLGRVRPRQRFPGRQGKRRRAVDQRLRAGALHEPDARRADLHRSPRQRAHASTAATTSSRTGSWSSSRGGSGTPKLVYTITFWTVLDTNQNAIFANLGYQFSRKFSLYAGLNGNPGTRSLQGSHPYWLGHDRVMADEFFRPYFGSGVWASGRTRARASGTTRCSATTTASSASSRASWTASSPPAPRCGGCRRRRSSARAAPTATGRCTRRWPRGSASPRRTAPRSASPTPPAAPTTPPSGWRTA